MLAIAGDHIVHVRQAFGVQGRIVGRRGIKGHADDIPFRPGGLKPVEHPAEQSVVIAVGNMDDYLRVGKNRLHRAVAAIDELGKAGEAVHRHPPPGVSRIHGPKHAVVGFITHLDPFGGHSGGRQSA